MKTTIKILYVYFLLLFLSSCEDLLIGSQPKIIDDTPYQPSLNIFGVLRPDSVMGAPGSFINLDIITPTLNDTTKEWFVKEAHITIEDVETQFSYDFERKTLLYDIKGKDSIITDQYLNYSFSPIELNTYNIKCYKSGFDTLFATTTIPEKPVILNQMYANGNLKITIKADTESYLYDVYTYFNDTLFIANRYLPADDQQNTDIVIETSLKPAFIEVYAYDNNMAGYYGSANVFIKPNTYRQLVTYVDNGYGCIGSVNKTTLILP